MKTRTLPRLVDMIGPDKVKRPVQPHPTSMIAEDGKVIAIGEPLPLDLSAVRRGRPHKLATAQDSKPQPWVYGEVYPIAD